MINQCSSCGGFCKSSGCERENVKPTPQRTWAGLTDEEANELWESTDSDWELMKRTEAKLKDKNT
jgi:hypothetical protein